MGTSTKRPSCRGPEPFPRPLQVLLRRGRTVRGRGKAENGSRNETTFKLEKSGGKPSLIMRVGRLPKVGGVRSLVRYIWGKMGMNIKESLGRATMSVFHLRPREPWGGAIIQ